MNLIHLLLGEGHGGSNDDGTANSTISNSIPQSPPAPYGGIKIYPNLGVDFSQTYMV